MGITEVVSIDGDELMVDAANPRPLNVSNESGESAKPPFFSARSVSNTFSSALRFLAARCFAYEARRA